jgi:hypothetical protein
MADNFFIINNQGKGTLTGINPSNLIPLTSNSGNSNSGTGSTATDTYVTGGTYNAGTATFKNNTGGTFTVSGFNTSGGSGSTLITLSKAALDTAISASTLTPGQQYKITGVDSGLYGGTDILIKAATTNKLELAGSGLFYNPQYDQTKAGYGIWTTNMEGTFSSITGVFASGETITANNGATAKFIGDGLLNYSTGNWGTATSITGSTSSAIANVSGFTSPSYAISSKIIWGGKHWTNVAGNIGVATDMYTLNSEWTVVAFNTTNYNVEIDSIEYDYVHDMIVRRKDKWNNEVIASWEWIVESTSVAGYGYGHPVKDFQWGNGPVNFNTTSIYQGVQGNMVKDSYMGNLNSKAAYTWFNTLNNNTSIYNNIYSSDSYLANNIFNLNSVLSNNILTNKSYIYGNVLNNGSFTTNSLTKSSVFYNNILYNGVLDNNTINNFSAIYNNNFNNSELINTNITNTSSINNNTFNNNTSFKVSNLLNNKIIQNLTTSGLQDGPYNLSASTIIFGTYDKVSQTRQDGTAIITYYNNSNNLAIAKITD